MSFNRRVAFHTLGCKVNQYETESLKKQFLDSGYELVEFSSEADYYVVNSCTVTSIADRKTRNMLRRAKKTNSEAVVIATGCYAQTNGEELQKLPEIDYVVGNTDKDGILNLVVDLEKNESGRRILLKDIFSQDTYMEMEASTLREMSRAYIKIQDGCDNFCSYCKIPFARGHKRSRSLAKIVNEVELLARDGFKEIIFIGINLGAYGEDLKGESTDLEEVIEAAARVSGIERIRLGSMYPDRLSDRFVELLKKEPKLMPHLHISLQSCDDKVLNLMNRKYDSALIEERLNKLKSEIDDIEFTADVIVGFPQEEEENFENTYRTVEKIGFSDLHIFQYSDRENTAASKYQGKISSSVKKGRADTLNNLRELMLSSSRQKYIGRSMKVFVEEIKGGDSYGYTENYLKVKMENFDRGIGEIITVDIKKLERELLIGEVKKDQLQV